MKNVELWHGDCLELMKNIETGTVDMLLTDLPYGTTMCKWDSVIDLELWWKQVKRICKPNAAIVLTAQTPFDKILGCSNLGMLRYEWIWDKPHATGFFNAKKMPMKAHENVLVFYSNLPTYNPIKTLGHERKTASRSSCGSDVYGKEVKKQHYDSTERYPRSIQRISSDKQKESIHSTQKPQELGEYMIKTYSNEGDLIVDTCMGAGSFLIPAVRLGRKVIGMDNGQCEKKASKYFGCNWNEVVEDRLNINKDKQQ